MSAAAMRGVVRWLGPSTDPPPDADLVAAFVARRDPEAFAALVARHGPTVLGVCQRVLGDVHDAEDAFQAVFLVLARKVKAVRPPGAIGGWLYGVAVRTANKARVAAARRRRREMIAAFNSASREHERPKDSRELAELRAALDEELAKFPETLRAVVVLCDLHGQTRAEAAAELRCPEGTVAARLHRARKKLGDALARRGLALPAAGLATVLVPATVSAASIHSTVAAVLGTARPVVLALAREVTGSMSATTHAIALGAITLLAGGLLAAGNLWPGDPTQASPPPPSSVEVRANQPEAAKPMGPWKETKVVEIDGLLAGSVAYSADSKTLFVGETHGSGRVGAYDTKTWKRLWEYKGEAKLPAIAIAPDGKTIAATTKGGVQFLDAATGKAGDVLEEKGSEPLAVGCFRDSVIVTEDEKALLSRKVIFGNSREYVVKSWLAGANASTIKSSTVAAGKQPADEYAAPIAVSPDGKRVVVTGPIDRNTGKNVLWAWSAGSGVGNKLLEGHKATVVSAAWSRNGTVIVTGDAEGVIITWDATTFKEKSRLSLGGRVAAVAVSPDGKHLAAATVRAVGGPGQGAYTEEVFVWQTANQPEKPSPISEHKAGAPFKGVASLAFASDGKTLASAFCNFVHLSRLGELRGKVRIFSLAGDPPPPPIGSWNETNLPPLRGWMAGSAVYSGDGKTLFVGGTSGRVRAYEVATWKQLWEYQGQTDYTAVAMSPDDKSVAVTFKDGVRFLDAATGESVGVMEKKGSDPLAVAFFPPKDNGKKDQSRQRVVFGSAREWYMGWGIGPNGSTINFASRPEGKEPIDRYAVPIVAAPDGSRVFVTGPIHLDTGMHTLWAWSAGNGKGGELLEGHKATVVSGAWSKNGKVIVTGDADGTVITWDAATFKEKSRLKFDGRVVAVEVSPDGKHTAAAVVGPSKENKTNTAGEVFVWPMANVPQKPEPIHSNLTSTPFVGTAGLAFAPDGKSLAFCLANFTNLTRTSPLIGHVKVFEVAPIPPEKPAAPPGYVQDAGFSPDGKRYLVLKGAQAHVHDTATGKVLYSIAAEAARFTIDGESLMVMGAKAVLECDAPTGKVVKEHPRPKTKWGWHLVAFAPDGKRYAAHFGFNVRVFDTTTGEESVQLDNQYEPGSSTLPATVGKQLIWSPDGKQVAAVGVLVDVGKMGLAGWDVASGKRFYSFAADFEDGPRAVAFSADSKAIAIGYEKRIDVWTGGLNPVKQLGEQGLVTALALTPDGKSIAAGIRLPIVHGGDVKNPRVLGHHTQVRLIDIATDKVTKVFDGFEGANHVMEETKLPVTTLAVSPDGKKLLAGTGVVNMTALPPDVPKTGELKTFDITAAAPAPPGDGGKPKPLENAALRKFQGAWKLSGFDLGGGNTLSDEEIQRLGWTLTIEGNKFQMADKDGKGTSSGRIAVDDSQKPPVLVRIITDRENDLYGWSLYELDGDTLRLCQDVHQKGKPKEFKAGPDTTIATYKRVKK